MCARSQNGRQSLGLNSPWEPETATNGARVWGRTLNKDVGTLVPAADPHELTERCAGEAQVLPYVIGGQRHVARGLRDDVPPARKAGPDVPRGRTVGLPAAPAPTTSTRGPVQREAAAALFSREIPRFRRSERALHWSIAIPFLVCLATGIAVKLFFNHLHPQTFTHAALHWSHRISGFCLLLLPILVARRHRNDLSLYLYNIKRAWTWTRDDFRWLALAGPAMLSRRVTLPEQHKFNAGEKLNFMALTLTYPILVATGAIILMPGMYFLTWIVHVSVAVLAAPLIFGHLFMAVVNPDTRIGLSGMFSGNVDREWAKHHYAKWYRENFGEDEVQEEEGEEDVAVAEARALVRCSSCGADTTLTSWDAVLASVSELRPLDCPACGAPSPLVFAVMKPDEVERILEDLEHAGVSGTRRNGPPQGDRSPSVSSADTTGLAVPPCLEGA